MNKFTILLLMALGTNFELRAAEQISIKCEDGLALPGILESPDKATPKKLVILLHGSGPETMDEDLSASTIGGQKNLFFKDLSDALLKSGFSTIRYEKRSYFAQQRILKDTKYANSTEFKSYAEHPLKYFVDDAKAAVKWAKGRFPDAKVYLLGHSEGAQVALWAASGNPSVSGLGLIGFSTLSLDQDLFEQTVYRSMWAFESLDKNHDGILKTSELTGKSDLQKALAAQLTILDLNADKGIDKSEYMAGNLSNLITDTPSMQEYRADEAALPRLDQILKDTKIKTIIFQGEMDGQTPAYHSKAIQLLNNLLWKNDNLRFIYFPGLGHALDRRTDPHEVLLGLPDAGALTRVAEELL